MYWNKPEWHTDDDDISARSSYVIPGELCALCEEAAISWATLEVTLSNRGKDDLTDLNSSAWFVIYSIVFSWRNFCSAWAAVVFISYIGTTYFYVYYYLFYCAYLCIITCVCATC